jgi:hypothetical protein
LRASTPFHWRTTISSVLSNYEHKSSAEFSHFSFAVVTKIISPVGVAPSRRTSKPRFCPIASAEVIDRAAEDKAGEELARKEVVGTFTTEEKEATDRAEDNNKRLDMMVVIALGNDVIRDMLLMIFVFELKSVWTVWSLAFIIEYRVALLFLVLVLVFFMVMGGRT